MPDAPANQFMANQRTANQLMKSALTWAIRFYPAEKRAWGEAILAEADFITDTGAAVSWTLGGLMVAFRAYFSRLLGGRSASDPVTLGPAQTPPPVRWKLVLVCLAIVAALLFVPELRQALQVTFSTWRDQFRTDRDPFHSDRAAWQKIGREAESRGDAEAMAAAAVRLGDTGGAQFDEAVRLAERAVAKDASLTWIYCFLAEHNNDYWFKGSPHPELSERLQAWDPQNAVTYLVGADAMVRAHQEDPPWKGLPGFAYLAMEVAIQPDDMARLRERDPRWREMMDRAVAAPTYDDYFTRKVNLQVTVMRRLGLIDTQFAMNTVRASWFFFPPVRNLREYVALRFAEGAEAERRGHWQDAANEYSTLLQFGQRMSLDGKWREAWIARDLQEAALNRLQSVLLKLGRPQEAQTAANQSQLLVAEGRNEMQHVREEWESLGKFSSECAFFVHLCSLVMFASAVLMVIALGTFAVTRVRSGFVRSALTWAPLLLVAGCAGLLLAYHPYAEFYGAFLANPATQDVESFIELGSLRWMAGDVGGWIFSVGLRLFWWSVIGTGSAVCIWLTSRAAFWRARPQSA